MTGYRMPAEWERHEGTWMSWPKYKVSFPGEVLGQVEEIYLEIIRVLQRHEKIFLLVNDAEWEESVRKRLSSFENVYFSHIKTVDIWTRDYAPVFVKNRMGDVAAVKWIFNAWGNKYREPLADNKAGEEIAKASGARILYPGIILEGGSIDTNGRGTFLTTEECLLNKNRNPGLNKQDIENYLKKYLGAEDIIWLRGSVPGDDTDSHVDNIARFVNEDTIVSASAGNFKGKNRFNIVELPVPEDAGGLPKSYANFYIANNIVLLPVFNDKNDKTAVNILQGLFSDREVIPIYCTPLVHGLGAIHCATQQQPG